VQVLQELIGNEKKYVSVMEELLDTYLAPLETNDSLYVWVTVSSVVIIMLSYELSAIPRFHDLF